MKLKKILIPMRIWHWRVHIQALAIASFLLLVFSNSLQDHLFQLFLMIIYLYIPFTFAYLVNVFMDEKIDTRVGKKYFMGNMKSYMFALLIFSGLATLFVPFLFKNSYIVFLGIFGFVVSLLYSLPPIKLKERGFWGLSTAALIQRIPFLFFLILLPNTSSGLWIYLFGWLVICGYLVELGHQLYDYENDRKTNVSTFVVRAGYQTAADIVHILSFVLLAYLVVPIVFSYAKLVSSTLSILLFVVSQETLDFANSCAGFYITYEENNIQSSSQKNLLYRYWLKFCGIVGIILHKKMPRLYKFLKNAYKN